MYVHRLKETAFIGVHTGHLGFYADWTANEVEKLVIDIAKSPYDIVEYPLLQVKINFADEQETVETVALNESMIKTLDGSVVFDVEIRDRKSTRLNSSHVSSSYAVFCLTKKKMRTAWMPITSNT